MDATAQPDLDMKAEFLKGMSLAACTVNIVTTDGGAGRFGATVSAMSSVSADGERPTLLVCIHHKVGAAAAIIENGHFCVNVLKDDQAAISDGFAGRIALADGDKFSCAAWSGGRHGQPHIAGALARFECRLQSKQQVGSHFVFIGEVLHVEAEETGSPLIYSNRAYGTLGRLPEAAMATA